MGIIEKKMETTLQYIEAYIGIVEKKMETHTQVIRQNLDLDRRPCTQFSTLFSVWSYYRNIWRRTGIQFKTMGRRRDKGNRLAM